MTYTDMNSEHEVRDLPVRAFLLFGPILRADSSEFADHEEVEEKDEYERYENRE